MYLIKKILLLFTVYFCLLTDITRSQTLEVVNDDELLDLCRSENQVVVLFSMFLSIVSFISYLLFGIN